MRIILSVKKLDPLNDLTRVHVGQMFSPSICIWLENPVELRGGPRHGGLELHVGGVWLCIPDHSHQLLLRFGPRLLIPRRACCRGLLLLIFQLKIPVGRNGRRQPLLVLLDLFLSHRPGDPVGSRHRHHPVIGQAAALRRIGRCCARLWLAARGTWFLLRPGRFRTLAATGFRPGTRVCNVLSRRRGFGQHRRLAALRRIG